MIEIAMAICLTIMGIYFFKSTELPRELQERSLQMRSESNQVSKTPALKFNQKKLEEMSQLKKVADVKQYKIAIDELTLLITSLEQEIKINNVKNEEIQKTIDAHLVELELLQAKVNSLA